MHVRVPWACAVVSEHRLTLTCAGALCALLRINLQAGNTRGCCVLPVTATQMGLCGSAHCWCSCQHPQQLPLPHSMPRSTQCQALTVSAAAAAAAARQGVSSLTKTPTCSVCRWASLLPFSRLGPTAVEGLSWGRLMGLTPSTLETSYAPNVLTDEQVGPPKLVNL